MAEIVQRNCESTTREIEDLRQMKLFSDEEITQMVRVRKHMEAKINGYSCKNIDNFKEYIEYESLILQKIRKNRGRKKIAGKTNSIDYSIVRRIRRLYETALQRFPSEYPLHQGFFEFCKKNSFTTTASQAIDKMLKMFPLNPVVWKLAADWFHKLNDVDKALQTINKGLTLNPQSQDLYVKAIELELGQLENDKISEKDRRKWEIMHCDNIESYTNLFLSRIKNVEFMIDVLGMLEKYRCTYNAQLNILEHLFQNHSDEDSVWHMFAQRDRKGLHFESDSNEDPPCDDFTEACLVYCVEKYKQGLTEVAKEKKKKLWYHFIETLLEINEENSGSIPSNCSDFLKNTLEEALVEAHSEKCLDEKHYLIWLNNLTENQARRVLEEATAFRPTSEELWEMRFRLEIKNDEMERADGVFKEAVEVLKEKSINMWMIRLAHHHASSEFEKVEEIFEEGIKQDQPVEISGVLKPKYIKWIVSHKDVMTTRKKYREIAVLKPYCKELHDVMSKLEMSQTTVSYNSLKEVHDLAINQFGSGDFEVILNYVKFILFWKPDDLEERIQSLYVDAERRLPHLQFQQFRGQYQLLLAER